MNDIEQMTIDFGKEFKETFAIYDKRKELNKAMVGADMHERVAALADALHKLGCTSRNHVEDCDYHYGSWIEGKERLSMAKWYIHADNLANNYGIRAIEDDLDEIERAESLKRVLIGGMW